MCLLLGLRKGRDWWAVDDGITTIDRDHQGITVTRLADVIPRSQIRPQNSTALPLNGDILVGEIHHLVDGSVQLLPPSGAVDIGDHCTALQTGSGEIGSPSIRARGAEAFATTPIAAAPAPSSDSPRPARG